MDLERELEDLQVPDVIGEVIGWRSWYVYQQGSMVRLASLKSGHHAETIWTPGQWMQAECAKVNYLIHKEPHLPVDMLEPLVHRSAGVRLPVESCTCGWYAAVSREHLVSLGYNRYTSSDLRVIGEVGMAGKVIRATQGWRAERVRPVRLYLPYEKWQLARVLEDTYGVPVELSNTWKGAE